MQTPATDRIEFLVQDLTNLVVCETERVPCGCGDQLCTSCLVQRVEQCVFVLFGGGSQFVERKDLAEYRAETKQLVALLTDAIETMSNRFFHALRDHHLVYVAAVPSSALTPHRAAFDQCFQNFLDEEGIALRLAMHGDCKFAAHVFAEQRAELVACFGCVETSQHDARDESFAVPVDQRPREPVSAVEFRLSISADDQHALVP